MSQAALVNPSLLTWSRERAGLSTEQVAKKLPAKPARVAEWEAGETKPTFLQAQKWASLAHIPFGFLFLPRPPVEQLPLPDLRTVGGLSPQRPSLELLDTVRDSIRKQDWYLEYLQQQEHQPLAFVGRFNSRSRVAEVVDDIRRTLGVNPDTARLDYEKYSRALIEAAEVAGILVMRSGIALGNTHRKLEVSEFRGLPSVIPTLPLYSSTVPMPPLPACLPCFTSWPISGLVAVECLTETPPMVETKNDSAMQLQVNFLLPKPSFALCGTPMLTGKKTWLRWQLGFTSVNWRSLAAH